MVAAPVAPSLQSSRTNEETNLDDQNCSIESQHCNQDHNARLALDYTNGTESSASDLAPEGYDPELLPRGLHSNPLDFSQVTQNPVKPFGIPAFSSAGHHATLGKFPSNWPPHMPLQNTCFQNNWHAHANLGPYPTAASSAFPPGPPFAQIPPLNCEAGSASRERRSSYQVGIP